MALVNSLRSVKSVDGSNGPCDEEAMSEQRFVDLEIKLSHHEQMLEDLSSVIFRQQLQIDSLESIVKALKEQLKSGKDNPDIGPADDKPPHY